MAKPQIVHKGRVSPFGLLNTKLTVNHIQSVSSILIGWTG